MYNKKTILILFAICIALIIAILLLNKSNQYNKEPYNSKPIIQKYFETEILIENLDTPWAIDFLPDNRMIFTERGGKVSILDNNQLKIVGNIEVSEKSESGLLGIAIDPEFDQNNYLYLYYTYEKGNRISRFILNEKLEEELILIDNIPSARFHDGGRIKFGPDGKLYITTGDATTPTSAQDINSLSGKILRINKDGTFPEDNPFKNYVYSYGHRNPQGLAWNPTTKELYASEHGPTRNDEINKIIKGQNYGWPNVECNQKSEDYINALRCFSKFTLAPSAIAIYKNNLYISGLRGKQIRKIVFDESFKTISKEEILIDNLGRIREIVEHEGYLYISTSNKDGRGIPKLNDDRIIRIKLN